MKVLKSFSRQQYICMAAAAVLTLAAWLMSGKTSVLIGGGELLRGEPGSSDMQYELEVKGIGKGKKPVNVDVSAREYTESEANAVCEKLIRYLQLRNL